jgi:Zn-dependent peptidase ImmA (M78 family)
MASRKAQTAAYALLDAHDLHEPPVDVEALANLLGVRVVHDRLEREISGMLVRPDGDAPPVIGVNSYHPIGRQRFTIAHELGHLHLHRGREVIVDHAVRGRVNFRDPTSSLATDREEIEANAFAAALLMPGEWVAEQLDLRLQERRHPTGIVEALAEVFGVSRVAMENRLMNLGLSSAL